LPPSRPHDLRHYFGTAAKRAGISTRDIADVMGHRHVSTTNDIYLHVDTADQHAVSEAVASTLRLPDATDICPHCQGTGRLAKAKSGTAS
jgi:integrase